MVVIQIIKIFFVRYSSFVSSCHLFLISSASVRSLPFLSFIMSILAWHVPLISPIFSEISRLSHSIVFLYFFALFIEEHLLISPCFSETAFSWVYLSLFPLPFASLLSLAICKASSDSHFAFLRFFFFGMAFVTASYTVLWTSIHSSSGTLSTGSNPLNLFVTSTVYS